jgi:hypothetical protein
MAMYYPPINSTRWLLPGWSWLGATRRTTSTRKKKKRRNSSTAEEESRTRRLRSSDVPVILKAALAAIIHEIQELRRVGRTHGAASSLQEILVIREPEHQTSQSLRRQQEQPQQKPHGEREIRTKATRLVAWPHQFCSISKF